MDIFKAVQEGDLETVKWLVFAKSVNVNAVDSDGNTPLMFASANGDTDIISVLAPLSNVNSADVYRNTALIYAVVNSRNDVIDILLYYGADINASDDIDNTPLMLATHGGSIDTVKTLLKGNPDLNAMDLNGYTAMTIAAEKGYTDIVMVLLQKGADPNIRDNDGNTALFYASEKGNLDIVKILIPFVRVNARNDKGMTALMVAALNSKKEVVKLLLANDAEVNARDNDGMTAMDNAVGHKEITEILENAISMLNMRFISSAQIGNLKDTQRYIQKYANIDAIDPTGSTALILACQNGHIKVVEYILSHHPDPELANNYGVNPLIAAASNGRLDIVKLIVPKIHNINACDNSIGSALHYASRKDYAEIVELLLKEGASPNIKNVYGIYPLEYAADIGHIDIIKLLIKYGADSDIETDNRTIEDLIKKHELPNTFRSTVRAIRAGNIDDFRKYGKFIDLKTTVYKDTSLVVHALMSYIKQPDPDTRAMLDSFSYTSDVLYNGKVMSVGKFLDNRSDDATKDLILSLAIKEYESNTKDVGECRFLQPGRYMGGGGYGQVKKVTINGETVAVKEGPISNLMMDANIGKAFTHKYILHVKRILTSFNCPQQSLSKMSLITEFAGSSLRQHIKEGDIPVSELSGILSALQFLFKHGIVYSDLKPENILVTDHGLILGDLGSCNYMTKNITTLAYKPPSIKGEYEYISIFIYALVCAEVVTKNHIYEYVPKDHTPQDIADAQMSILQNAKVSDMIRDVIDHFKNGTLHLLKFDTYAIEVPGEYTVRKGKSSLNPYMAILFEILKDEKPQVIYGVLCNFKYLLDIDTVNDSRDDIYTLLSLFKYINYDIPMKFTKNAIRITTLLDGLVRPYFPGYSLEVFDMIRDVSADEFYKIFKFINTDETKPNSDGNTPLMLAIKEGRDVPVKDINAKNKVGDTALIIAVNYKRVNAVKKLLMSDDININSRNNYGHSALMIAALTGNLEILQLLLSDVDIQIDLQNKDGWTALMFAASKGETAIAELLIERGANVKVKSTYGETAYDLAKKFGYTQITKLL
jgi:ankyrin repeat protein